MKRKFVCGITVLCLALSVAGCGKNSEEQQAANYYQNELGLDKEEADELAHELYGNDDEDTDIIDGSNLSDGQMGKIVVEPLPELLNSEWYEEKVQIYDMIFSNDWYMTEEDIRAAAEGSAYDVELSEDFDSNGNIVLRNIMINGETVAQVWKDSRGYDLLWNRETDLLLYGLIDAGEYYSISYGFGNNDNKYDKDTTEFADLETRDDVLAYLADNGFVEVEEAQATYASIFDNTTSFGKINPLRTPVEYADTPHYYSRGVQSITFYRIHRLSETDQTIEERPYLYDGAYLNLVNRVTFEFDTNGIIASLSYGIRRFIVFI